jgi:hypothetical protein
VAPEPLLEQDGFWDMVQVIADVEELKVDREVSEGEVEELGSGRAGKSRGYPSRDAWQSIHVWFALSRKGKPDSRRATLASKADEKVGWHGMAFIGGVCSL